MSYIVKGNYLAGNPLFYVYLESDDAHYFIKLNYNPDTEVSTAKLENPIVGDYKITYWSPLPDNDEMSEIMAKDIEKSYALDRLLEALGDTKNALVACGDGFNDISMIEYAGMGVAMANAQPAVKDVADFITRSNDDDGIALVCEMFFSQPVR